MFGNAAVRFDVLDAQIKLNHLRKLHKVVEKALLEFPFKETEKFVSLLTSEPWDQPVSEEVRTSRLWSSSIEASVMARFQRQSALCTAYAVFEFTLLELARNFRAERQMDPDPVKNKHKGLRRASWLFADAGYNLPMFSNSTWKECLDIADVRNKVMHSAGLIPLSEKAKFSKINGVFFEDFSDGSIMLQLCIESDYVKKAFRIFEEFLDLAGGEIERTFS